MPDAEDPSERLRDQLQALVADNNVECEICQGGEAQYPCPKCNPAEYKAQRDAGAI